MNLFVCLLLASVPIALSGQSDPPIGVEDRERILAEVARQVESTYVLADAARTIAEAIRSFRTTREFTEAAGRVQFAKAVNRRIQETFPDLHLALHYSPMPLPDTPGGARSRELLQAMERGATRTNFGFTRLEQLAGNVAYMKVDAFHAPELASKTAAGAMAFAANAEALIIDLRDNQGGDPEMVAFLSSFLLGPQPIHLNDLEFRSPASVRQFWTMPVESGMRFQRPVYVLTSHATVSAGEEFAYNLQARKRITVVGATTAGGAHLTKGVKVHAHFVLTIPFARAVNPVTGTNWERRGVEPDIAVAAGEALLAAHEHALRSISASELDPNRKRMLDAEADRIRTERSSGVCCS